MSVRPSIFLSLLAGLAVTLGAMLWAIELNSGSLAWAAKPVPPLPFQEVEIDAGDGAVLMGRLYDPSQKPESEEEEDNAPEAADVSTAPSVKYPLVILLHGLNGGKTDWGEVFVRELVQAGYAVYAPDLRGHGESTRIKGRGKVTWRIYNKSDWEKMPRDVEAIIRYFRTASEDYPQVNAKQNAVIGAKLGANVAIIAGSKYNTVEPEKIKALVLISPSLNYKGLETSLPIVKYKNPVFVAASQTDITSYQEAQLIYRWALGAKVLRLYKNVGDSTDLIKRQPDLQAKIIQWLGKHFPAKS